MDQLYFVGSSEIIGQTLVDSLGKDYGKVDDIIFSSRQKRAVLAIISANGNLKSDYIALPYQALRVNPNTQKVMTEIDTRTIENAPAIDKGLLLEGNEEELTRIFSYYGFEKVWQQDTDEAEPLHEWYKSGDNTGEHRYENEGSNQLTQDNPSGADHNKIREEMDFDKVKGITKDK